MPRDRSDTFAMIMARIREHFSGDPVDRSDRIATIDTITMRTQSECCITQLSSTSINGRR